MMATPQDSKKEDLERQADLVARIVFWMTLCALYGPVLAVTWINDDVGFMNALGAAVLCPVIAFGMAIAGSVYFIKQNQPK